MELSVVSPVYGSAPLVEKLVGALHETLGGMGLEYEIILVEDGSPDVSWAHIIACAGRDRRVRGLRLSRNFGQHAAITAGLAAAKGRWVVVMDCDLQDRPEEIPRLYAKAQEGFDSVFARRVRRRDGWFKRSASRAFYALFGYLTDSVQDPSVANFGIYHRRVVAAILAMGDQLRYFPTMAQWVGFRRGYIDVAHGERSEGRSAYTLGKLLRLALDTILAFSDKPLRLMVRFGLWVTLLSALFGVYTLWKYWRGQITEPGFASIILSIWFLAGTIIFMLGVVGLYIGRIFTQVKNRPTYIVSESTEELP